MKKECFIELWKAWSLKRGYLGNPVSTVPSHTKNKWILFSPACRNPKIKTPIGVKSLPRGQETKGGIFLIVREDKNGHVKRKVSWKHRGGKKNGMLINQGIEIWWLRYLFCVKFETRHINLDLIRVVLEHSF